MVSFLVCRASENATPSIAREPVVRRRFSGGKFRIACAAHPVCNDLTVGQVNGVAMRIVRREPLAEEVVSDVYMQVWRDASRYDTTRGKVLGWLLVIARSRAPDILRRQDEAFSHSEIVEQSGIALGSVKTHIRRALGILRDQLSELDENGAESELDAQET